MVASQKKKVTNPGIRQRVLDALTDEPKTFDAVCAALGWSPIGVGSSPIARELGVLCSEGRAQRERVRATAQHTAFSRWVAAPHVLKARRIEGRDQRVAGLLRDAERADLLWFSDEAINDLAAWAGVPQYFMLGDSSAKRRQRIGAWYVLRRAIGEAGARHLPLSLATNPEMSAERPAERWVRILRAADIPVWMDQPEKPGVWFVPPSPGRTLARLDWVSGEQAKDAAWGPDTAMLLNRACALLRAAGLRVESPVPAKPADVCGAFPTKPGDVLRCALPAGHDPGTHGTEPTWAVGDRVRHTHERRTGEIVDQRPFDLFKVAFDGESAANARWVTKSGLDAYYTRESRDAQPPAKIDDAQLSAQPPRQDGKLSPQAGAAYYELLTSGPFGLDRDSEIKARLERAGFKDLDLSAVFEELHAYAGVVYPPGASTRRWMLPLLAQPSV